jgi:hypothetical protein
MLWLFLWSFICPFRDYFIYYSWSILESQCVIYSKLFLILWEFDMFWHNLIYGYSTLDCPNWPYGILGIFHPLWLASIFVWLLISVYQCRSCYVNILEIFNGHELFFHIGFCHNCVSIYADILIVIIVSGQHFLSFTSLLRSLYNIFRSIFWSASLELLLLF